MKRSRTTEPAAARIFTIGRDRSIGFTAEGARADATPMCIRDIGHARSGGAAGAARARLPARPETLKQGASPWRIR